MTVHIGLDLTAGSRPSSLAALDDTAHLLAWGQGLTDTDLLAWIAGYPAALIAVDAPLSLPLGLCCLEPSCRCRPGGPGAGRSCERALSRLGLGCYYTTKRSIIKALVYRAIALKAALEAAGHTVIEVYPHASRVRLLGRLPKKTTLAGRRATQRGLQPLVAGLPSPDEMLLDHDTLDAVLAAYTGWLCGRGQTVPLGDPAEGLLYIPAQQASLAVSDGWDSATTRRGNCSPSRRFVRFRGGPTRPWTARRQETRFPATCGRVG